MDKIALSVALTIGFGVFLFASITSGVIAYPFLFTFTFSVYYMVIAIQNGVMHSERTLKAFLIGMASLLLTLLILWIIAVIIGVEALDKYILRPKFFLDFIEWFNRVT